MSNVHSSRVVEEEGDEVFRFELPQGMNPVGLREGADDGEVAEEPATEPNEVVTIKKIREWDRLKNSPHKSGIHKLVFEASVFYRGLNVNQFPDLEEIIIKDTCLQDVKDFIVDDCGSLTTISVGSFCLNGGDIERHFNKVFCIRNCPNLERIIVGEHSCRYFDECTVDSQSMKEVSFKYGCFENCKFQFSNNCVLS